MNNTNYQQLVLLFCLSLLFACSEEEPYCRLAEAPSLEEVPPPQVSFSDLQVGQESRYVSFFIDELFNTDPQDFSYNPDTLILRVEALTDLGYLFTERLTRESAVNNGTFNKYKPTFLQNITLILSMTASNLHVSQDKWHLTPSFLEFIHKTFLTLKRKKRMKFNLMSGFPIGLKFFLNQEGRM